MGRKNGVEWWRRRCLELQSSVGYVLDLEAVLPLVRSQDPAFHEHSANATNRNPNVYCGTPRIDDSGDVVRAPERVRCVNSIRLTPHAHIRVQARPTGRAVSQPSVAYQTNALSVADDLAGRAPGSDARDD